MTNHDQGKTRCTGMVCDDDGAAVHAADGLDWGRLALPVRGFILGPRSVTYLQRGSSQS